MKYGVLFSSLAFLLAFYAFTSGGWFLFLLWPAISFGVVGLAYLTFGHGVCGKRLDGTMRFTSVALLLPYLLYLWGVWHLIRVISRENPFDTVVDGVIIGRRLLSPELPLDINTVVDLTSEFIEPRGCRLVPNYIAAPMLDASVLPPQLLADLAMRLAAAETPIYIHCAQGHGRTGLVSSLLLIARGDAVDPDAALALVQSSRPLVGLNRVQTSAFLDAASLLQASEE